MSYPVEDLIRREVERRTAKVRVRYSVDDLRSRAIRRRYWRRAQTAILALVVVGATASGAFAMTRVLRLGPASHPAISRSGSTDGRIVFVSDRSGEDEVYTMNPDGTDVVRLTHDPADDRNPAWSPDGSQIVFDAYTETKEYDLFVMNADGTGLVALTTGPESDEFPAWSPDGSKIAFARDGQVFVINADGTALTQLTNLRGGATRPAWSPDGNEIAFVGYGQGSLYVMNTDGSGAFPIHRMRGIQDLTASGSWSPDGNWILFTQEAPVGPCSSFDIYRIHPDGTGMARLTRDGGSVAQTWSPDGSKVLSDGIFGDSCVNELVIMNADGSGRVRLTDGPANNFNGQWAAKT